MWNENGVNWLVTEPKWDENKPELYESGLRNLRFRLNETRHGEGAITIVQRWGFYYKLAKRKKHRGKYCLLRKTPCIFNHYVLASKIIRYIDKVSYFHQRSHPVMSSYSNRAMWWGIDADIKFKPYYQRGPAVLIILMTTRLLPKMSTHTSTCTFQNKTNICHIHVFFPGK